MDKKELSDMRVFPIIEGLEELEKKEKWEEARVILYDLWSADKENLDFFMRLSSECWFLVAEWEVEKTNGLDWEVFQDTLIECMTYGIEVPRFYENTYFLCIVGYMITLLPELCFNEKTKQGTFSETFLKWEAHGREMLAKAVKQDPIDLVMALYLGFFHKNELNEEMKKKYVEARESVRKHIGKYFPGNSAIEQYFKEVFSIYP